VNPGSPAYQQLEQRLTWLRELAGSLENARAAVLHSDLAELRRQTDRQRELCAGLRQLNPGTSSPAGERWQRLLQEARQMEMQVAHLNREYGFLLAHARHTVDIFCRVLANSDATYLPPKREAICFQPNVEG